VRGSGLETGRTVALELGQQASPGSDASSTAAGEHVERILEGVPCASM